MDVNFVIVAALVQAFICAGVVVFQICLASGAPWGEYALGGQNRGVLPKSLRITSVVSALIMLAQSGHYLAQADVLPQLLGSLWNEVVNWFWFAFAALGLIMNAISRSKKERTLWLPVLAISVGATLIVALNA